MCLKHCNFLSSRNKDPESGYYSWDLLQHTWVYHQVQEWIGNWHDPFDFGWKRIDSLLFPKTSDLSFAPDHIKQEIKCQCKSDCKTNKCSCKKFSLLCTEYCKCNEDCINVPQVDEHTNEFLDHDDNDLLEDTPIWHFSTFLVL